MHATKPTPYRPARRVCDCGQPGSFWYNGWECPRCKRLRLEQNDQRKRELLREAGMGI